MSHDSKKGLTYLIWRIPTFFLPTQMLENEEFEAHYKISQQVGVQFLGVFVSVHRSMFQWLKKIFKFIIR